MSNRARNTRYPLGFEVAGQRTGRVAANMERMSQGSRQVPLTCPQLGRDCSQQPAQMRSQPGNHGTPAANHHNDS
jgi:hypothetical protein